VKHKHICSSVFLTFCCIGLAAGEVEPEPAYRAVWNTTLSYDDWMDAWPTLTKMPDGYFVAGISHRKTDEENYECKVVLWKIDTQGKELWVKDINPAGMQADRPFLPAQCLSLQDEPMLLIIETLGPRPRRAWLVRLDEVGSIVFSKELSSKQIFDIKGLVKTNDCLLLYGSVHKGSGNSDACVTKSDIDGNEIWRREYDKGKMEGATGLAPQKDGGFILAADSGNYNKFGGGPSEVWIIKCDRDGNSLCETTFEGRHPSVTVSGNITAVLFNKEDFPQQDVSVVGLDEELKTLWRIDSLFGKAGGLGMLRTIVNKKGNFVLAGNKFRAASIWEITKQGRILREMPIEGAEQCVKLELLQTQTGYLVAGHATTMSKMPLTADGKVAKGTHRDSMDILVTEVADLAK